MTTESPMDVPVGDAVLSERRGAALWLRLNRPEALNGICPPLLNGLMQGLDEAEVDDEVRAVVIAAEGRVFCAGGDLKYIKGLTETGESNLGQSPQGKFLRYVGRALKRIEDFPKPVIAALEGLAVGGGTEILLCCDMVVASESARIGDGHANYGLVPGGGATIRMPRRLGPSTAKRLMFTGQMLPARELASTDLITALVDDDEVVATIDELVEQIAAKSPLGIAHMKRLANLSADTPVEVGLDAELQANDLHEASEDFVEGVLAFNEKRTPLFRGR